MLSEGVIEMKKVSNVGKHSKDVRFDRADGCRAQFLKHKHGLFGSRLYTCVYCGRLIGKDSMEVDHMISVGSAKTSSFVRNYIRFIGLFKSKQVKKQGVNGVWNLVAACRKCNGAKSDTLGMWVVRGAIGKIAFPLLWYGLSAGIVFSIGQFMITGGGAISWLIQGLDGVAKFLQGLSNIV